jgi:hypothetical protein
MKVLLRDDLAGLYYAENGEWVARAVEARDFRTLPRAGQAARECKAARVSVVLAYEEPPCELALNPEYCA